MPPSDSSATFMQALRPKPSPAVLLLRPAGVSEVSRFSCMKLPGVSGVYDYAGPDRNSRYRPRPCCLPPMQKRQRPDCIFSKSGSPSPPVPLFTLSLKTPAVGSAKSSGPSGSLLLSRRTSFIPRFMPVYPGAPHWRFTTRWESARVRGGNHLSEYVVFRPSWNRPHS